MILLKVSVKLSGECDFSTKFVYALSQGMLSQIVLKSFSQTK